MNKYIVELIGTFFLVFTVGNVVLNPDVGVLGPLAIGSVLMVMIFAGGHISGGHFNPAVTLAATLRGACPKSDTVSYMIAQVAGGAVGALLAMFLWGGPAAAAIDFGVEGIVPKAMLAEFLITFALCYVVLQVATAPANDGNSFYGLAIGFTVLVGAVTVGGISGGAFNPAVAAGLCFMKKAAWSSIWIYLVPQLAAGAAAAYVFMAVQNKETES
jgi:aquaporin Z